jgi:tetratricopeptide (TPR) repeat protein
MVENSLQGVNVVNAYAIYDAINFYEGNCAVSLGSLEQAVVHYERSGIADETARFHPNVWINLAWTYIQLGNAEQAIPLMQRAFHATVWEAQKIDLLTRRSRLYALIFDYKRAVTDADYAIISAEAHYPHYDLSSLYVLRGQMYLLLYEWDKVLADYTRPSNSTRLRRRLLIAALFIKQGPARALADFERYSNCTEGEHADEATGYVESIRAELDALGDG